MPAARRGYHHDHLFHDDHHRSDDIDVFDHRAAHDDLHAAGYHHVYVHDDGGPDDEHLDYHYPAPWPYDHNDHHRGDDIDHHYDDGCPDNHAGLNDHHDDVPPGRFDLNDDDFATLPILDLDNYDASRHHHHHYDDA